MGRRHIILNNANPYHIFGRSNNKEWFYLPEDICWEIFIKNLQLAQKNYALKIHSFLLMSNHYHLTCTTPRSNISEAMHFVLTQISKAINKYTGRINHVFGGRYKWKVISDQYYYYNAHKYIYRNPVDAKIVTRAEAYKNSTLAEHLLLSSRIQIEPSPFGHLIPSRRTEYLDWLNLSLDEDTQMEFSKAFRLPPK